MNTLENASRHGDVITDESTRFNYRTGSYYTHQVQRRSWACLLANRPF